MFSHEKRLRTCFLIMSLIMKFTSRMTRCLLIATSTHSLAQSLVSFANSSMTCSARGSSDCHNHQVVCPSSLLRKRTAPCDSVWTSKTSTRSLRRIDTQFHSLPTSSTNWAAQRSTPSSTSMLATIMFVSQQDMSGKQPSEHVMAHLSSSSC